MSRRKTRNPDESFVTWGQSFWPYFLFWPQAWPMNLVPWAEEPTVSKRR